MPASRGKYGKPGVYNETDASLGDGESSSVSIDKKARTILAPTNSLNPTLSDGRKTVTTAGTAVSLVASTTPCTQVTIMAEKDNTGVIVVGGSTVVAALSTRRGVALNPGDSISIAIDDLVKIYLDSTVNGDGVTYFYLS